MHYEILVDNLENQQMASQFKCQCSVKMWEQGQEQGQAWVIQFHWAFMNTFIIKNKIKNSLGLIRLVQI